METLGRAYFQNPLPGLSMMLNPDSYLLRRRWIPARLGLLLLSLLTVLTGCNAETAIEPASPAAARSGQPRLFARPDGPVYLSWIEPAPDGDDRLMFSTLDNAVWSPAREISRGSDWFVNWADTPSLVALADGSLVAHWLVKNTDGGSYAYDVLISASTDAGTSWTPPQRLNRDRTSSEHGFVSMLPLAPDRAIAVWLDGRHTAASDSTGEHPAAMSLRSAILDRNGALLSETEIDAQTCDCCRTGIAAVGQRVIAVYRDRSDQEIRDIAYRWFEDGHWGPIHSVHDDHWEIQGCPVNGPAVDAHGDSLVVTWPTAANGEMQIRSAFWSTDANGFARPVRVDEGNASGRVAVAALDHGRAVVLWMEQSESGPDIRYRTIDHRGKRGPSRSLSSWVTAIPDGFPALVADGGRLILAWTDHSDPVRVRTVSLSVPPL